MVVSNAEPKPIDSVAVPRFGDIATFMRLPLNRELKDVDIAISGVPCDLGAGNRAGSRHGPRAIREMSALVRRVHPVSLVAPYDLCRIADVGDSPVNQNDLLDSIVRQEAFFKRIHKAGAAPLTAGGGHLISLPIMRAITTSSAPLGMFQIDAHSDTNDVYQGNVKYNSGTMFRRAIEEGLLDPKRTVQIGIRGTNYSAHELDYAKEIGIRIVSIEEFRDLGVEAVIAEARKVVGELPYYLSFDIDGIDPCFAPATGTPEIGGLTSFEAQQLIRGLEGLEIVGADMVEVAPPYDHADMTSHLAANLMFEILCVLAPAVARRKNNCRK